MEKSLTIKSDSLSEQQDWIAERNRLTGLTRLIDKVDCHAQLDVSSSLYTVLSKHVKALERERKAITGPIDKIKKSIMDSEKTLRHEATEELLRIKKMNDGYATLLAARAEAERRQLAADVEAKALDDARRQDAIARGETDFDAVFGGIEEAIQEVGNMSPPKTSGGRIVTRWSFDVVNSDILPRKFLTVNSKAITAYLKVCTATGVDPEINGVVFQARAGVESSGV